MKPFFLILCVLIASCGLMGCGIDQAYVEADKANYTLAKAEWLEIIRLAAEFGPEQVQITIEAAQASGRFTADQILTLRKLGVLLTVDKHTLELRETLFKEWKANIEEAEDR